jgi:PBSX family phage terminase large subunit
MSIIKLTKRQTIAFEYLMDNITTELCFGGSAGGGKSMLASLWLVAMCIKYPGIRCLLGRTTLSSLKQTSLNTLFEVMKMSGMEAEIHYNYNGQSNTITFNNKSEIILKDLEYKPSDPNFDSLAGLEITCAVIEEASQVTRTAYNIVKSRIRFKLNEYGLVPKILMTTNPSQGFLKKEFYIPYTEGTLPENIQFIPSLPLDNPHLPQSYIDMLNTLPSEQRKRLLLGDWNYNEELDNLFSFDEISNSCYRQAPNPTDKKYICIDVARFGSDSTVISIWVGLTIVEVIKYNKIDTLTLSQHIKELITKHGIHPQQVIADSDGVGGPLVDMIKCTPFVNNARPLHDQNFTNLKSQCYVKLSDLIKQGKISINIMDPVMVDDLTNQLLAVKLKDVEKDGKVGIIGKDQMKRMLGDRSPDLADSIMLRMYYEIKNLKSTGRYAIAIV